MRLSFPSSRYYCSTKVQSQDHPSQLTPAFHRKASTTTLPCRQNPNSTSNTAITSDDDDNHKKIIVILGATGSGKSRLSIDLATHFPAEIINSDKMQLYKGLDITTNKIPPPQRRGVPHHLLGDFDPSLGELTPSDYRSVASSTISIISSNLKLPLIAGGSNSFIYALLARCFHPDSDVFDGSDPVSAELRYNCCFLWVDVSPSVLDAYLIKRVDDMLESGMVEELAEFFAEEGVDSGTRAALRKAIGVPEFAHYFRMINAHPQRDVKRCGEVYEEAVRAIKDNTCRLARRQVGKIRRLRDGGWDLRRLDATPAFRAVLASDSHGGRASDSVWGKQVMEPSVKIVKRFLEEE